MPNLNKRQIEFRKQMKQLEKVKDYKEIIDEHNDFYNNTAYEQEILNKYYKKEKTKRRIIYFFIITLITAGIYKNLDFITSKLAIAFIEQKNDDDKQIKNFYGNTYYTNDEVKQYKIAQYHLNYKKRVEAISIILSSTLNNNNLYNLDNIKINEQLKIINDMIVEFNNYIPEEINKNLHLYDCNLLIAFRDKCNAAINLSNNYYDNNLINNFNAANKNINYYSDLYRTELLSIFNKIGMQYTILENGTINFTYKIIE
ncbi:MAG: hypothetical protein SA378_01105 [Sedimentibacter sp.]|uniref:hypothetical protein n=1 Tax=Sedimentibacter sp. TaxID=1960295 RepID=UPI00298178F9|nr:hypothetical protein [Sedimentibacter sp.]MDW5298729.1 hypothetical protein [Sedimentibacter sp.]